MKLTSFFTNISLDLKLTSFFIYSVFYYYKDNNQIIRRDAYDFSSLLKRMDVLNLLAIVS